MKLYIHFGIYKAGSSYLQYVCANSREFLQQHKIYFPYSKEDRKMQDGLISKGNADGLELALKGQNVKNLEKILLEWFRQAENLKCDSVLVSAEALVHQLAKSEVNELLLIIAKKVGFIEIHAMGFFRDLVDHALSTFKHRAKSGKIKDFEYWLYNVYETPDLLVNLANQFEQHPQIQWSFRKFRKDGVHLNQVFFKEWLKIDIPKFEGKPRVNESLTLSEITLMQHLEPSFPLMMEVFIDKLNALPIHLKANDKHLDNEFFNRALIILRDKNSCLMLINKFFREDEQLALGMPFQIEKQYSDTIILSKTQLDVLSSAIYYILKGGGRWVQLRKKLVSIIPLNIRYLLIRK